MFRSLFPRLVVVAVVLALAGPMAPAQVKPFFVSGSGPAPEGISPFGAPSPHGSTGHATHLGRYTGDQGLFTALSFDPLTGSGTFKGSFVFVAANGDKLACTYGDTDNGAQGVGTFQVIPASDGLVQVVFLAEFNPILAQCTGRFADLVGGSFLMLAATEPFPLVIDENGFTPPFEYSWAGAGWIEFKKKK